MSLLEWNYICISFCRHSFQSKAPSETYTNEPTAQGQSSVLEDYKCRQSIVLCAPVVFLDEDKCNSATVWSLNRLKCKCERSKWLIQFLNAVYTWRLKTKVKKSVWYHMPLKYHRIIKLSSVAASTWSGMNPGEQSRVLSKSPAAFSLHLCLSLEPQVGDISLWINPGDLTRF